MFCKKCGAELRLNAKFCAKCGAPVATKAPEAVKPATPPAKSVESAKPSTPVEEVKTLLTRDDSGKSVIYVPPTETVEAPKLVVTMGETKSSSSNGQFDEWFSDPGDL